MNSVASVLCETTEITSAEVDAYLTNVSDEQFLCMDENTTYYGIGHCSPSSDPLFFENGVQLSFDSSCYTDYSGSAYSGYSSSECSYYPELNSSLYNIAYKSEPFPSDGKYSSEGKYSVDGRYSMETKYSVDGKFLVDSGDILSLSPTPNLQYLTPKMKSSFEYSLNGISSNGASKTSNITSNMAATMSNMSSNMSSIPSNMNNIASIGSIGNNIVDVMTPGRNQYPTKVSTHDLALFNTMMDGNPLTPMKSNSNYQNSLKMQSSISTVASSCSSSIAYDSYSKYYPYDENTNSPYLRQSYGKNMDLLSYPEPNLSGNDSIQDMYPSERPVGNFTFQNNDIESIGENYFTPTSITRNVVTTFKVPSYDPSITPEERYREILKIIFKIPPSPETFLTPISSHVLNSESITELSKRYDDSQRIANPPETHVVYVRNGAELNLVLRNDNLLIQNPNQHKEPRNEKLKLTKQVLNTKNIASSSDLNESMIRSRNDEQGMSYLPYISCNWKGVHETSWWMSDDKGVVRNFKVKFDPVVFGSKAVAFEEATKFAKYVEGLIRPGSLIKWYPGFNIPIGTSGRANLRKVLHMDRMKNSELCDPVLEANGLKVAAKSTFGDMIIVELYKAAYVLGLWDVAAYNCLKTCKRRGYSFEWIHDIQSSGKRITLDALKYMRNVKELIEQDKLSRVNSEKKRRRRKLPDKRKRVP
ncbi:uncharacterized protein TA04550 [Theileria annulata]|uniref:Uncharacterized protein n=1 Tax=Theileria annulata TaxID=5874 RepID=Q4UC03_THEAN|nr:uncharacterized protein TA04550 [Theileria annulata]CAI75648.1 hypothetical protein TA04550 [Theileria annulata]|eukprot:XP_955124.1 hypothetical protein TA04550 [Theileria annulata]